MFLPSHPPNVKRSSWSDALAAGYVPGDGASPTTCLCSHNSEYGSKVSTTDIKCCLLSSEKSCVRPPCTSTLLPILCEMWKNLGRGSYLAEDPVNREKNVAIAKWAWLIFDIWGVGLNQVRVETTHLLFLQHAEKKVLGEYSNCDKVD